MVTNYNILVFWINRMKNRVCTSLPVWSLVNVQVRVVLYDQSQIRNDEERVRLLCQKLWRVKLCVNTKKQIHTDTHRNTHIRTHKHAFSQKYTPTHKRKQQVRKSYRHSQVRVTGIPYIRMVTHTATDTETVTDKCRGTIYCSHNDCLTSFRWCCPPLTHQEMALCHIHFTTEAPHLEIHHTK